MWIRSGGGAEEAGRALASEQQVWRKPASMPSERA
jgi:hypothetical protein